MTSIDVVMETSVILVRTNNGISNGLSEEIPKKSKNSSPKLNFSNFQICMPPLPPRHDHPP
jgi:hypothetical protein